MSRPAAVVISPEAPYPMHGGGAIRTASLLHYLSPRYDLDLILFRQAGDSDPALSLPPLARQVWTITLPFHSRRPIAWLLRNGRRWVQGAPPLLNRFSGRGREIASLLAGRRYDVGLIEHFWCAPYVQQLAPVCGRTILDLHNIESELHGSCARSGSWPHSVAHSRFERAYIEEEKRWLPRFSRLLAASHEDAGRLHIPAPDTPVTVYRNALPLVPVPAAAEEQVIAFSGNFEYHPNIAAVKFLVKEIWPQLAGRFPGLKLRLIGRNPGAIARYINPYNNGPAHNGNARIETTGSIEDAIAELARSQVAIVPLLSGSGTRLKILEAWAAARPVVATSIGAEGLGARPEIDIVLSDTPDAFIASVSELLGSKERRRRIGSAGRHTYEEVFTWEKAWQNLPL
jgi:glycosyltransferase involved in cell wall biosynthesis